QPVLPSRARPGDVVEVDFVVDAAFPAEVSVSAGTWTGSPTGGQWQLPSDIAVNLPETQQLRLQVEGCTEVVAELDVRWEEADRVLVLYNTSVPGSEEVATAYAEAHALPEGRRCAVSSSSDTEISSTEFLDFFDTVAECINAAGPQIHYLVPVYGVPYKVAGKIADITGNGALSTVSLDALLVLGSRGRDAQEAMYNPLYQEGDSMAGVYDPYVPFGELREDMRNPYFLVSRIDGADTDAALALLQRSIDAQALADADRLEGTVYVDGRFGETPPTTDEFGSYESGEWNMWGTRSLWEDRGRYPVIWDGNAEEFGTAPAPTSCPDALLYAGWYSYYNYNDAFVWAPGAIGGHLDSCSACDLRAGTWSAEALRRGITATFGAVNEPYVAGMPEYDQFFLYLSQGATFGEAAYESTRLSLWMMVFVGDPLYRPFP
ncbi:MAG TPA: TIGR03790 family protein, partial [Myxococcota bacterium]|nr:TIGR03790 family protein [Myxococcota bacterium]